MKKLLSLILAMMLLFTLSLSSLAEDSLGFVDQAVKNGRRAESTVTIGGLNTMLLTMLFGVDSETLTMVQDTLNALSFTGYTQGNEVGFAVNMQNTAVANIAVGQADGGLLIGSKLLGDAPVILKADEAQLRRSAERILMRYAESLGLDPADIPAIVEMITLDPAAVNAAAESAAALGEIDLTAFDGLIAEYKALIVSEPVTAQPADCDAADTLHSLTISPEQAKKLTPALIAFVDANPVMRDAMVESFAGQGLDWDADKAYLYDLALLEGTTVAQWYTAQDELVKLVFQTSVTDGEGGALPIAAAFNKLSGTASFAVNFANMMQLQAVHQGTKAESATQDVTQLQLTIVSEGTPITIALIITNQTSADGLDATDHTEITLAFMGMALGTITVDTQTTAPAAAMTANGAMDLAAITDGEFDLWALNMESNAAMALMSGIVLLPQSVQQMLFAQ